MPPVNTTVSRPVSNPVPPPEPAPEKLEVYSYQGESPAVVFLEMQNASGTVTLHFTLRAAPGEDEEVLYQRVTQFILARDPNADVVFKAKDAPNNRGGFGGQKAQKPVSDPIPAGGFTVARIKHTQIPKKNKDTKQVIPGEFWHKLICYSVDGKMFAEAFANLANDSKVFEKVETMAVDVEMEYKPPSNVMYVTVHAENKPPYGWNVTSFEVT
jgi:hypothetical protein